MDNDFGAVSRDPDPVIPMGPAGCAAVLLIAGVAIMLLFMLMRFATRDLVT